MKLIIIALLLLSCSINSQEMEKRDIALLPILSNGIDEASTVTIESMLRMELGKQNQLNLITEKRTLDPLDTDICLDEECAREIGKQLNLNEVIICKLNRLGEKIIVQYILTDVETGKNLLAEQTTALNLDDLEHVMKRVALSVAYRTSFDSNAEVGNIVGNESISSLRRRSRYNFGVGFGYLYPQNSYKNNEKSFTLNAYFDHEIENYAVGLMAGARDGFAINIYGNYLFSKTDLCPYLGTSVGVHWVQHEDRYEDYRYNDDNWVEPKELSGNGIELGIKGGIRLLHTYNVQLFINLEYLITFNDYDDKAIVFSIGIL